MPISGPRDRDVMSSWDICYISNNRGAGGGDSYVYIIM